MNWKEEFDKEFPVVLKLGKKEKFIKDFISVQLKRLITEINLPDNWRDWQPDEFTKGYEKAFDDLEALKQQLRDRWL